jgi:large subunit ribosomal protein L21
MSYAIISVGGKQYRVREGERLLVDRVGLDDGATFTPPVLLVGGDGDVAIAPADVTVTARVVTQQRGPKIRIGKYKQRTGYRRHTGFRAALTQIEIESIGGKKTRATAKPKTEAAAPAPAPAPAPAAEVQETSGVPEGYAELTVAQVKDAAGGWDATTLAAALEHEQAHAKRKGAIAALESALQSLQEEGS